MLFEGRKKLCTSLGNKNRAKSFPPPWDDTRWFINRWWWWWRGCKHTAILQILAWSAGFVERTKFTCCNQKQMSCCSARLLIIYSRRRGFRDVWELMTERRKTCSAIVCDVRQPKMCWHWGAKSLSETIKNQHTANKRVFLKGKQWQLWVKRRELHEKVSESI